MRFQRTGIGVVLGAALGLLLGMLAFDGAWWAPVAGAALGLVAGAIGDGQAPRQG